MLFLKYNFFVKNETIAGRIKKLINKTYKLLPLRQQNMDWQKPLETIIEEIVGVKRLLQQQFESQFFLLISKMEGLYSLKQEKDFLCYRRTIFECLGLMNTIKQKILCQQKLQQLD